MDEIYEKAKQQVVDHTADDSNEEDDDNQDDSGNDQDGGTGPTNEDPVFELDDDINLDSLFLQDTLSDTRVPTSGGTVVTTGPVHMEVGDCEPTDEEWGDM